MTTYSGISPRRIWLVARRDYLGYVKTWGFWLSFCLPILFGAVGFYMAQSGASFSQPSYETILDDTGVIAAELQSARAAEAEEIQRSMLEALGEAVLPEAQKSDFQAVIAADGVAGGTAYLEDRVPGLAARLDKTVEKQMGKIIIVDPPADTIAGLTPWLKGERKIVVDGASQKLGGALHIYRDSEGLQADYWSTNVNARELRNLAQRFLRDRAQDQYLSEAGLSTGELETVRETAVEVTAFDPLKATDAETGQEITTADRLPYLVAAGLTLFLWLTVFSGSYMLLTSMLEEKLGKLMEMMLASTRFSEIMLGKLLGVAALTITAMLPYLLLGGLAAIVAVLFGPPEIRMVVGEVMSWKMIVFFPAFLILGYVFYGCLFIALGAMSESMQDAQTLTTPIMILLTACILVVPVGLDNPNSSLVQAASWFPLSAPFASIIRLPSDPPLWELLLSTVLLTLCTVGVAWLATRIFRHGVLSGAGLAGVKRWAARTLLRRKPA